ncbi:MAG: GTP-binding protein [Methanomassiliicoccus sp.]|nr:GTP-binding protein [Methanomassiliicoccus sp.]
MTTRTRFAVIGGYLGAGKTTLLVGLARYLKERHGKDVAIITNDQGHILVDTQYASEAGFDVREVMGGCFCSTFPEFVKNARSMVQTSRPDVILAEPIGTSTNILSSVVEPLRAQYPEEFDVAPFLVVVDATRAAGMESSKRLIPAHQVREAEVVLLSKADRLDDQGVERAMEAVKALAPDAKVMPYSARTGQGMQDIASLVLSAERSAKVRMSEDHKRFAAEKSAMSWYSSTSRVVPSERVDLYDLATSVLRAAADSFPAEDLAHVKVMITSPRVGAKMSLVADSVQTDGVRGSRYLAEEARLVVNARVMATPKRLGEVMRGAVETLPTKFALTVGDTTESCYSPRPETPMFISGL